MQLFEYPQFIHSICWTFRAVSNFDYYGQRCYEYSRPCLPHTEFLQGMKTWNCCHGVYVSLK